MVKQKLGSYSYYSLPAYEKRSGIPLSRLPISLRIMLEALLRHEDGKKVTKEDIERLARWNPKAPAAVDVPFCVSRVILQDFTGVPLLVDLAAMRDAMAELGKDPKKIEPQVPVDLVVDHSVQVDRAGTEDAFLFNLKVEFERNKERYEFLKWGQEAFETFQVVPPGIGIVHQVNLEHIATVVAEKDGVLFPDTLVGTDSHTTMINGLGVVGWGVGGIEAEAAMLGEPVAIQTPEVIGMHLSGALQEGVTATDLTLCITQILRKEGVVNKFVEFFGEGAASLSVADRATIGNMAPEYGATIGFFPADEKTIEYLKMTGRPPEMLERIETYLRAQHLFGIPRAGTIDYTKELHLDLSSVAPCVSGPKRPQDRILLGEVKEKFAKLLRALPKEGGYGKSEEALEKVVYFPAGGPHAAASHKTGGEPRENGKAIWSESEMVTNRPLNPPEGSPGYTEGARHTGKLCHGSVVIAAITSCTNTSNPSVMIGAGLVAKRAVERGLSVSPLVKTSLAPGSRVVTDYLKKSGLDHYLDQLGFQLVAYGCTTCIGNSGPLDAKIEQAIKEGDLITASVLSGNRNFEARIHGSVKANFLMSPPLVVAYALAGRMDLDLVNEPLAYDPKGRPVFLKELWPTAQEIEEEMRKAIQPTLFTQRYGHILTDNPIWKEIRIEKGTQVAWDPKSTYIRCPPYFENFSPQPAPLPSLEGLRTLLLLGDSVTTDHISPAGAFKASTPAGRYLLEQGVPEEEFNSYGSRRGNHEVMMRGTFANVRIVNRLGQGKEGGWTTLFPEGTLLSIYDASLAYKEKGIPLIIFAGKDYGMGSSRDWAAKGTALLGVRVVVAESFERIHRSNLIGMGVLPLRFAPKENWESLGIQGDEVFSIQNFSLKPKGTVELWADGKKKGTLQSCLETAHEVEVYRHGGLLPFVLRKLI